MITACSSSATIRTAKAARRTLPCRGFPFSYIVQAMTDFKSDARKSSDPRKTNTNRMIAFAKGDDRRGDQGGRHVLLVDEVDAVD